MSRYARFCIIAVISTVVLFALNIISGAVKIPLTDIVHIVLGNNTEHESWKYIILDTRLPQAITATLCGSGLAVSGLLLQTAFRNPLAGPSIFGIDSGAGLGVAVVMLLSGGSLTAGSISLSGIMAIIAAAFGGAAVVMAILLLFSSMVKNNVMLLIIGIMTGYISSSAVSLLNFFATEEGVHSYMIWGLGNFGGVSTEQIPLFSILTITGLICSLLLIKPLNAVLIGKQYAENLGVNTRQLRSRLLIITGILTAITTAFCGPVAFIGLAVPHMARLLLKTDNQRQLIPATIITGAATALLCNIICTLPGENGIIPLNAVTPVIGAPVIIYVIIKSKRK